MLSKKCNKEECRHWINHEKSMNCTIIAAKEGPMTLQQIGDIFGVTRMRICQIEKRILKKLNLFLVLKIISSLATYKVYEFSTHYKYHRS